MLIILPLLTFFIVFLDLAGLQSRRGDGLGGVRLAFLKTLSFLGGYLLVFSEILSLFRLLTGSWTALCWGFALLLTGWVGWRKGLISDGWRYLRSRWTRPDRFDWTAGSLLVIILLLLFLTAIISPPNNNDSLQYHMSRVMHWAQNSSLRHYATGFQPQLTNPIWAETAILNIRLLWGDDKLANLVQWGCLIGTLAGATELAKILGADRRGQWVTAAFTASLPMAILQATSTQNDLVTAFWLVNLLIFITLAAKRNLFGDELASLACAFGLGLATKGTFYPYAVPPMIYFIILEFKRVKPVKVILDGAFIGLLASVLNLGYWERNILTYGGPLGSSSTIQNRIANLFHPGSILGSIVRNVFLNLATPVDSLNHQIVSGLKSIFHSFDPQMVNFNLMWGWNHEDLAGNPLHLLLIPLTCLVLIIFRQHIKSGLIVPYLFVTFSMYVMLSAFVMAGVFDGRYQLPFFVAWSPIFGVTVSHALKKLSPTMTLLLLLMAFPWILFNRTRPLIAMRASTDPFTIPCLAGCTTGSILSEPPVNIIFGAWVDLREPYTQATDQIKASGCRDVGLQLDSHDLEYLFWWLLDAPQSGIHLETIYTYPALERYLDPTFKPCAILCTICKNESRLHGLDLVSDYAGKVQLFMGSNYDPNPDK